MPLIVDPALQAAVIRQFNLRGELAPFNLTENVVPIFDIGQLIGAAPTVVTTLEGSQGVRVGTALQNDALQVMEGRTLFGDVVDSGFVVNPGAAGLLVDTGQLVADRHHIEIHAGGSALFDLIIEWRNAANAANVATWSVFAGDVGGGGNFHWKAILQMATNERIRVVTGGAVVGTVAATIHSGQIDRSDAN